MPGFTFPTLSWSKWFWMKSWIALRAKARMDSLVELAMARRKLAGRKAQLALRLRPWSLSGNHGFWLDDTQADRTRGLREETYKERKENV